MVVCGLLDMIEEMKMKGLCLAGLTILLYWTPYQSGFY